MRRALAAVQKLTHSDPEIIRKASLAKADRIISEPKSLPKFPSNFQHFTNLVHILAELQVLKATLAELKTG